MAKNSLLILCAGFGTRMLNLTSNSPKPLLKVNNKTLLANSIEFFLDFGFDEIFINTHYLHNKIETYINKNFNNYPINIIYEPIILGTGGAIKNVFNYTNSERICVVNSDILWNQNNKLDIKNFFKDYDDVTHCKILLSNENNFHGLKKSRGDFIIHKETVSNWIEGKELIYYSGLQVVCKTIFEGSLKVFPINEVWHNLIINKNLKGNLINSKLLHVGDKNTFEML